jgi:hypothetical protein
MNIQKALNHPDNNHTSDMIDMIKSKLPPGFTLYWSSKSNVWAFRKEDAKNKYVEIWDDDSLHFNGTSDRFTRSWDSMDMLDQTIRHVWG